MAGEISNLIDVRREMNLLAEEVESAEYVNTLCDALTDFKHQGLNVVGIVSEIFRRRTAGNRPKTSVQKDILTMVILFLANNVDKMLPRTNDSGRTRITTLKATYDLRNNVEAGGEPGS